VSLFPANEWVRATCISVPHRHAGNSAQPGTNNRSKSDMATSLGRKTAPAHITLAAVRLSGVIDKEYSPSKAPRAAGPRYFLFWLDP
jgi:hypothetical protein